MEKDTGNNAQVDATNYRVILVSCGSFNPPTYQHLRMFERTKDYLEKTYECSILKGIMVPIGEKIDHTLNMCDLMLRDSRWIRLDKCGEKGCKTPLEVLRYIKNESKQASRIIYVCGSDALDKLASSSSKYIEEVVKEYGIIVLVRRNFDPMHIIYMNDILRKYQRNIYVIEDETSPSNISSSRLRTAIRRRESIRYCTSDTVIQYIKTNKLYFATVKASIMKSSSSPGISARSTSKKSASPTQSQRISSYTAPKLKECSYSPSTSLQLQSQPLATSTCSMREESIWRSLDITNDLDEIVKNQIKSTSTHKNEEITNLFNQKNECANPSSSAMKTVLEMSEKQLNAEKQPSNISDTSNILQQLSKIRCDSPNYDNLTLDELIAASTNWVESLNLENDKIDKTPDMTIITPLDEKIVSPDKNDASVSRDEDSLLLCRSQTTELFTSARSDDEQNAEQSMRTIYLAKKLAHTTENLNGFDNDKTSNVAIIKQFASEDDAQNTNSSVLLKYRQYNLSYTPETTV